MLKLGKLKIKEHVNLNKNLQIINNSSIINKYHNTNVQSTYSTPRWDYSSIVKVKNRTAVGLNFKNRINFSNYNIRTSHIIKNNINNFKMVSDKPLISTVKEVFDISLYSYKKSLEHDCFHDIISSDEVKGTVTIAFLPISTSDKSVFCGIQEFKKVYINHNIKWYKNIYTIRLLYYKTMTKKDYEKWVLESKDWYQDIKLRNLIFNEIQKDLEDNHYSLLKDSDLNEWNVEFFMKELPLVKFKFTDLIE